VRFNLYLKVNDAIHTAGRVRPTGRSAIYRQFNNELAQVTNEE